MSNRQPRYRLIACDMDGTLFRQDLRISPAVQEAIHAATSAGVIVSLATGRMPSAARPFVELLGLHGPQLYYNGALVRDSAGHDVFHQPIPSQTAQDVVRYALERGYHVNAYVGDTIYVARMTPEAEFTHRLNQVDPVPVGDLVAFLEQPPTKLVVVVLPQVSAAVKEEFAREFAGRVSVSGSVPQYCEMVDAAVDKGKALRRLGDTLGIPLDQIMAIGDGDNDLTLVQAAGWGVAMGNATDRVKASADAVVGTVEEDGVAQAIWRYALGHE